MPATGRAEGGAAASWGENYHGQLGTIYRDNREESPVGVEGVRNIAAIAAGGFGLALLSDGTASAWGGNVYGQLGDGTRKATWEKETSHVAVGELSGVTAIAAGPEQALALLSDGTVKAWGNNQFGQLGNNTGGSEKETGEDQTVPKVVRGLTQVIAIASGGDSNFALLSNHTLMAWGNNNVGQLGIAESAPHEECNTEGGWQLCSKIPRPVVKANGKLVGGVAAIYASPQAAYALLKTGGVMSWGSNGDGRLGTGAATTQSKDVSPSEVMSATGGGALRHVAAVSASYNHALALLTTGQVVGWGDNKEGELGASSGEQCGKNPCDQKATPISGLDNLKVTAVSAGVEYSLALCGGRVYSFGKDKHGELGDGSTSSNPVPTAIRGLGPVRAISAGNVHAIALLQGGVEPPPPLITLKPGEGSLDLAWTFGYAERLLYRPAERSGVKFESITLGADDHGFVIDEFDAEPLEAVPHEVRILAGKKSRTLIGTPLPETTG